MGDIFSPFKYQFAPCCTNVLKLRSRFSPLFKILSILLSFRVIYNPDLHRCLHVATFDVLFFLPFFLSQSLKSLLGEELAEFLESEERERRIDAVRSRMRLLRDLRMDTRARGMWARLLNDNPPPRRHKSGIKKGGSTSRSGCFGHKMDRIGTISGMGC